MLSNPCPSTWTTVLACALALGPASACGGRAEGQPVALAARPEGAAAPAAAAARVATTHGLTIPSDHPRLWFDAARLARARTWWKRNGFAPSSRDPLGQALSGLLGGDAGQCRAAMGWAAGQSAAIRLSG